MAKQQSTSNSAVAMQGIVRRRCVSWLDRLQVIRKDYEDGTPERSKPKDAKARVTRKFAGKLN